VYFGSNIGNASLASKSPGAMCCVVGKSRVMDVNTLSSEYRQPGKTESFGTRAVENSTHRNLSLTLGFDTIGRVDAAHPEYHSDRYMP
jgi:hypothetical protein